MKLPRAALLSFVAGRIARNGDRAVGGEQAVSCSIEEARARHTRRLLELPGVVSVGIGLDAGGRPALVVGLDGPRPETRAQLPQRLEGHALLLREVGAPEAQGTGE